MVPLALYFQLHQPYRLREFSFFDLAKAQPYFDDALNELVMHRVASCCYRPALQMLYKHVRCSEGKVKLNLGISGVFMEQLRDVVPDVWDLLLQLGVLPEVEILGETYHHSLSSLYNKELFAYEVGMHKEHIKKYFGKNTSTFRNTELLFADSMLPHIAELGFGAVLTEGLHAPYTGATSHSAQQGIQLLLRHGVLSDDIAFRYSSDSQSALYPLTHAMYMHKLLQVSQQSSSLVVGIDFETLGEHHPRSSGIFDFFEGLLHTLSTDDRWVMCLLSELPGLDSPQHTASYSDYISWADTEKDASAWTQNSMQREALSKIYSLAPTILGSADTLLRQTWLRLLTSDHFYYMSTKSASDGEVHHYFSPFKSPYDAYIYYMNVYSDLEMKVNGH